MNRTAQWTRHAMAVSSMCIGGAGVFGIVYAMNKAPSPPQVESELSEVSFEVAPKPKPKAPKPVPKKRRQKPRSVQRSAPAPNLMASLAGASFSLPSFSGDALAGTGKDLLGDTSGKLVMTEGALDTTPRAVRRIAPKFPASARKRGVHGYVKMSVFVSDEGRVQQVRVVDAAPQGVFEQSAEQAIRDWEFSPGVYQGQAVSAWITQTIRFELKKTS